VGNGTFDDNTIALPVIVSLLPLSIEISVGASGDCEDCVVGWETVGLLQRLMDL
jgi:hypothetical protein